MKDIFADIDEQIERYGGSWTAYIIRALWVHPRGLSRQDVLDEVLDDALARGRKIPVTFPDVIQSAFQKHNSSSAVFQSHPREDVFQFVWGKGTGIWALNKARALAWMAANGRTSDFTLTQPKGN